jgi:hypothetical protein
MYRHVHGAGCTQGCRVLTSYFYLVLSWRLNFLCMHVQACTCTYMVVHACTYIYSEHPSQTSLRTMPQWYRNNAQVYCAEDTSVLSHWQDRIANGIKRNTQTLQLSCQQPPTPLLQQSSLLSSLPALHFDQLNLLVPVEYLLGESKSVSRVCPDMLERTRPRDE